MKSLLSIVRKLSQNEIDSFRTFLSSHSKNKQNKKLELFNELVTQSQDNRALFDPLPVQMKKHSRQSVYQLKKRLQEELYSFLISQQQFRNGNDTLFLEMDCHKKLYCFKILFDKGVHAHAYQILEEVLNVATKHSLHGIYLETLSLRNIYFPLTRTGMKKKILVSTQINRLKKNITRNLYINQYLSDSTTSVFESDVSLRRKLINEMIDSDAGGNEFVVDRLMDINHHLYRCDFQLAYEQLLDLAPTEPGTFADPAILGLIYIELIKSSICLNLLDETEKWLSKSEIILRYSDTFLPIILDLAFVSSLRSGNMAKTESILSQANACEQIVQSDMASAKWSFYSMFLAFTKRDFRNVIKIANADAIHAFKEKSWLIIAKLLEILSIYEMEDSDWLHYKIESLRKTMAGAAEHHPRLHHIAAHFKSHLSGKKIVEKDCRDSISEVGKQFPWHPLSNELINLCHYIETIPAIERPALTVT